jgi:hypothetical protein
MFQFHPPSPCPITVLNTLLPLVSESMLIPSPSNSSDVIFSKWPATVPAVMCKPQPLPLSAEQPTALPVPVYGPVSRTLRMMNCAMPFMLTASTAALLILMLMSFNPPPFVDPCQLSAGVALPVNVTNVFSMPSPSTVTWLEHELGKLKVDAVV